MWLNCSVCVKPSMSDTFDMLHTIFYYYYFNKITMATIRIQSGKRPTGTGPFRSNCNHADERLWLSLPTALQTLWPPSYSHPTKLTPTFILCTQSSFYPECSFCQLFARLSSRHSAFSSYIAFSERYSLSMLVEIPPVPDHSLIYQSIFLIFYGSHYYLKFSLVYICSFSFPSTRV